MSRWPMPFERPCYQQIVDMEDAVIEPCMYSNEWRGDYPDGPPCALSDDFATCDYGGRMMDRRTRLPECGCLKGEDDGD